MNDTAIKIKDVEVSRPIPLQVTIPMVWVSDNKIRAGTNLEMFRDQSNGEDIIIIRRKK